MRFSKRIIVLMFISVLTFVVAMSVIFCIYGSVPDSLVENFFGFFGVEGGALAIIKVGETLAEKLEKKKKTGVKKK